MAQQEQLSSSRYWVKVCLGFKYLKCGLESFVDNEVKTLQNDFLRDICKTNGRKEAKCTACTTKNTIPCPTYGICNVRKRGGICSFHERNDTAKASRPCPNAICDKLHLKIKDQHRYSNPSWRNTDASQWCTNHWQIAKCYLPVGGYEDKTSATETDCSGLLSVINNCAVFQNELDVILQSQNNIVSKILKTRNDVFHASNLELSQDQLTCNIDEMIDLLQDKKKLLNDTEAQKAVVKLKELKNETFFISAMDELDVRRTALNAIEEKTAEAIQAIETKQVEVMKAQHEFETMHDECETRQNESNARQNEFETRLTVTETRQEELVTWKAKLDTSKSIEEENRQRIECIQTYLRRKQELQNNLCRIYEKHLSTIPVSPVLSEIEAKVDDVFVELVICDDLIHEPKTLEKRTDTCQKVKDYRDVIYKSSEKCTNIYLIGGAGMGKTTWCMNLLSTWVRACKKKTSEFKSTNESMTTDEKTISDFDVVLFASPRHAAFDVNIRDMIEHQLYSEHPQLVDITRLCIAKEPHRCLIVLDGLDEWSPPVNLNPCSLLRHPGLPSRNDLHDCTVLTTTRPWKLDVVRLKDNEIDRAVKIQGIQKPYVLAEKIINRLNEKQTDKKKNVKQFESHVGKIFHIDSQCLPIFMEVPLILVFVICVWYQNDTLENTLAATYSELLAFLITIAEGDKMSGKLSRLSDIKHLDQLKDNWSETAISLPDCLQSRKSCTDYSGLLLRLAELAFEATFDLKGNENNLVFTPAALERKLSDEELQVAVKIGILSQSKAVGNVQSRETSLSFLHKTIQEYMAALHLVCSKQGEHQEAIKKYESYCSYWIRVREMDNVLIFVCGMNPEIASEMSEHVASVAKGSSVTDEIENRTLNCVQEVSAAHGDEYPSSLFPIHAYRMEVLLSVGDIFKHQLVLLRINRGRIKQLKFEDDIDQTCIEDVDDDVSLLTVDNKKRMTLIQAILQELHFHECVFTLSWINIPLTSGTTHSLQKVLSQMTLLRRLELSEIQKPAAVMDIDLSNCHTLEEFRVSYMSHVTFTLHGDQWKLLRLCDLKSCILNVLSTVYHLSNDTSAMSISRGADIQEINCRNSTECKINLTTTSRREIKQVDMSDCRSCELVILSNNTELDRVCHPDNVTNIRTFINEINCTETKNCKITLTSRSMEIKHVYIGNCSKCDFVVLSGDTEQVQVFPQLYPITIRTIIKQITCTESNDCKITLTTVCGKVDHVNIDGCKSCELDILTGNSIRVPGFIQGHEFNIIPTIKEIICADSNHCKITVTTKCTEIDNVEVRNCKSCDFVILAENTELAQRSIQDQTINIRTVIKEILCSDSKQCKIALTTKSTEMDKVELRKCESCEFVILTDNIEQEHTDLISTMMKRVTEYFQMCTQEHKVITMLKEIICTNSKQCKLTFTKTCTELQHVELRNCESCDFVFLADNAKLAHLRHLKCSDFPDVWTELGRLTPSISQLDKLTLEGSSRRRVTSPVIHYLEVLTHIKQLTCVNLDYGHIKTLARILPHLTQLERLHLEGSPVSLVPASVIQSLPLLKHVKHITYKYLDNEAMKALAPHGQDMSRILI